MSNMSITDNYMIDVMIWSVILSLILCILFKKYSYIQLISAIANKRKKEGQLI